TQALNALANAAVACAEGGWDGHGCSAALIDSYILAQKVIRALPRGIPDPEIIVEPDGEFAFEWHKEPRCTFVFSVSPDGVLSYSGLYGTAKYVGRKLFDENKRLPTEILWGIERVFRPSC